MDTDQWAEPWQTREARDARVRRDLTDGKTWFIRDGRIPAATVTIAERPNLHVWSDSECELPEPAVYVHRLVTARQCAGLGLGAQLIDWSGLRGLRLFQARWIMIDVWTTNIGLHQYYKMQRFEPCGFCADPAYPSGALFQKPVSEIGEFTIPYVAGIAAEFGLPRSTPYFNLAGVT